MENFAERLFVDLKNSNIKIEAPQYVVDGAKIGMFPNSQQFNIFGKDGKYTCGAGVTFQDETFEFTFTEAYLKFLDNIKALGDKLKFYGLVIPKRGVVEVRLLEYETVTARYIKDYLHSSDENVERWDVMVSKA